MARTNRGRPVVDGLLTYVSPSSITKADTCLRSWFFKYVLRKKEPSTGAQRVGTLGHERIETHLTTGDQVLQQMELVGDRYIPEPGPDLGVEVGIAEAGKPLTASGIPVVGYIDVLSDRDHYIDDRGEIMHDPGQIEVIDWKFTSAFKWCKEPTTLPMQIYGLWAARALERDRVRLSHVYFATKGRPQSCKKTKSVDRDFLEVEWNKTEAIVRTMINAARESDPSKVDLNLRACGMYGGCPHRSYCPQSDADTLSAIFGATASMGILDKIRKPEVKLAIAELQAAEAEAVDPALAEAIAVIEASEYGFPALGEQAARAFSAVKGHDFFGHGLAGTGPLAVKTLTDPADLIALAEEIKGAQPEPKPEPAGILPPDAPASKPELAALPLEPETVEAEPESKPVKSGKDRFSSMKKAELLDECRRLEANTTQHGAAIGSGDVMPDGLRVFVDAVTSAPAQTLDAYVDRLCAVLCEQFGAADIRCAPADGPLGFGKWKGALAALVRESPPELGTYTVDVRGREIAEVVVDALRPLCAEYVRGVR